jgi:hypothetical protein
MKILLLVTIFIYLIARKDAASSEEAQKAYKHPLTDMPAGAEDVETGHYFPSFTDLKFPIGQNVISLCHITNQGSTLIESEFFYDRYFFNSSILILL